MIYLLEGLHFFPLFEARSNIGPLDIPFDVSVPRVFMAYFPSKVLFTNFFNNIILSIENIKNHPWRLGFWFNLFYFLNFFLFLFCSRLILLLILNQLSLIILSICFNYLFCSWLIVRVSIYIISLLFKIHLTSMLPYHIISDNWLVTCRIFSFVIDISGTHFGGILLNILLWPFCFFLWDFVIILNSWDV